MTDERNSPPAAPAEAIDELSAHLRELGAESETERRVKRVVPWVSSLFLHAGMVILGFLLVTAVTMMEDEEAVEVVADFNQLSYEPLRMLNPNQAEVDQQAVQDRVRTESISDTLDEQLRDLDVDPMSLISDAASRSELADFAPEAKRGTAKFAGLTGTNARKIIFIVDASGSMIGTLQIVLDELARSIDGLSAEQEFGVVFFQKNEALVVPPEHDLIPAVPDEKIRALEWIEENVIPAGRSNPIEAIRHGLSLEPDVIFLLSNNITGSGQFEIDQDDLLALIDELNTIDPATGRRRTQIQCIQFLDPDPLDTLKKIAEEHSGPEGHKFLDRRELGIGGG